MTVVAVTMVVVEDTTTITVVAGVEISRSAESDRALIAC
jgi:hypothetical protein